MRILSVSDKVEPVLYGPYIRDRVGQIDLILACGDLPYYYLEYIVGILDRPLFFVHGNHDKQIMADDHPRALAQSVISQWATDLHARTDLFQGLLLAGFEGCRRYNPGKPYQYTDADVRRQVRLLSCRLLLNRIRYGRFLDVLITHAPPRGIHDGEDLPHQGFEAYLGFLRRFRPSLMIHGHQHVYNRAETMDTDFESTRIINTYGYRVLELAPRRAGDGWELISGSR